MPIFLAAAATPLAHFAEGCILGAIPGVQRIQKSSAYEEVTTAVSGASCSGDLFFL